MILIGLNDANADKPLYVNADMISTIMPAGEGSTIWIDSGSYRVKESPSEIISALRRHHVWADRPFQVQHPDLPEGDVIERHQHGDDMAPGADDE